MKAILLFAICMIGARRAGPRRVLRVSTLKPAPLNLPDSENERPNLNIDWGNLAFTSSGSRRLIDQSVIMDWVYRGIGVMAGVGSYLLSTYEFEKDIKKLKVLERSLSDVRKALLVSHERKARVLAEIDASLSDFESKLENAAIDYNRVSTNFDVVARSLLDTS